MPEPPFGERSLRVFPGGSLGEYNLPPDLAVVLARGDGASVWDADGRRFTDMTMGWGSVLLGHAHPRIVEAVTRQAALGSNFAYVSRPALELGEEIMRAVACAGRVRFCASGTEATAYCVRLARAATGRPRVLKFEGAYHGANEIGTVSLFPRRLLEFPEDYRDTVGADRTRARAFLLGLFRRGIFLNPMSTKFYLSLAHGAADIAAFLDAARASLREDVLR